MDVPPCSPEKRGEAICGSARDLNGFTDESIDIVLSDPPYFDNIAYSELAEFFQPWLKMMGVIPQSSSLEQVKLESLMGRRNDPETLERYEEGRCEAFGEIARVLKPAGILVFSFRHIMHEAWHALARAIVPHALDPIRVIPAPGEAGMGLHAHSGTGLWDAVLVLKKGMTTPSDSNDLSFLETDLATIAGEVDQWADRLGKSPLPFTQVDKTTLWRSTLIMTALERNTTTQNTTGTELPLLQALRKHL